MLSQSLAVPLSLLMSASSLSLKSIMEALFESYENSEIVPFSEA